MSERSPSSSAKAGCGLRRGPACVPATAAFLLLLQLAGLAHFSLVRHAVCLEHGEYTHAGGWAEEGSVSSATTDPKSSQLQKAVLGLEDGDDHCSALVHRREQQAARISLLEPAPAVPAPEVRSLEAAPVGRGQLLFRLAPKQSPPV